MDDRMTEILSLVAQSDLDFDDGFGITIVLEESRPIDEIYSWLQTGVMQDIAGTNSASKIRRCFIHSCGSTRGFRV